MSYLKITESVVNNPDFKFKIGRLAKDFLNFNGHKVTAVSEGDGLFTFSNVAATKEGRFFKNVLRVAACFTLILPLLAIIGALVFHTKNTFVSAQHKINADKDAEIANRDATIANLIAAKASRDAMIVDIHGEIEDKDDDIQQKDELIHLRDQEIERKNEEIKTIKEERDNALLEKDAKIAEKEAENLLLQGKISAKSDTICDLINEAREYEDEISGLKVQIEEMKSQ